MAAPSTRAASRRVLRTHIPDRADQIGMSVRAADRSLGLDGGSRGLLDTTHFDTVRFPPPPGRRRTRRGRRRRGTRIHPVPRPPCGAGPSGQDARPGTGRPVLSPADNLALTPGTQAGLFTTLSALVDDGDLVLVADPDYLFNERILAFLGARVRRIGIVDDGASAALDLDALDPAGLPRPAASAPLLAPEQPDRRCLRRGDTGPDSPAGAGAGHFRIVVDSLYSRLVY